MKKHIFRRILAIALCAVLCAFALVPAAGTTASAASVSGLPFTDIDPAGWYIPYLQMLYARGMVNGVSAASFLPQGNVRVCEALAMVCRYLGWNDDTAWLQRKLTAAGAAGANLWYSGYVQAAVEDGLLLPFEWNIAVDASGDVQINPSVQAVLESNITRQQFVDIIIRSFELNTSGPVTIPNRHLTPEISPFGNEFIAGGGYDTASLGQCTPLITDFMSISQRYAPSVLKAVYDGIVNGDTNGNFNATNLLTRAEMTKLIAAVLDYSLRTAPAVRALPDAMNIGASDLQPAGYGTGDTQYLTPAAVTRMLTYLAGGFSASPDGVGNLNVRFTLNNIVPAGYFVSAKITANDVAAPVATLGPDSPGYASLPCTCVGNAAFASGGTLTLTMREAGSGELMGTYTVKFDSSGMIVTN